MSEQAPGRPIHVLFLLVSQSIGGAEIHAIALANGLQAARFRVSLAYLKDESDGADLPQQLNAGIAVFCPGVRRKFDVAALRKLLVYCKREAVDLVVCANPFPLLYASALRSLYGGPLKIVEILHSTEPFTVHARVQMTVLRPLFRMTDLLVYVCNYQRTFWERNFLSARCSRVIYNGVDLARFSNNFSENDIAAFRARFGFGDKHYLVGVCGYMRPEKAHGDLVAAIAMARARGTDVKCLLIGDGPMRKSVELLVRNGGLGEHVAITGLLGDVRLAVAACDVIAVPSRNETFSMAALESMALGKPVIMSDVGGAAEMVGSDANGYLYPKGDIAALSQRIELLADGARRAALGRQAWETVATRFSAATMVAMYAQVLSGLVAEGKVASHVLS
ncbi:hypothetical protein GCM10027321_45360 [Massilia terrae]|uniref:Glycosyltransferase n=1 Tax=Massilia terrae TaxID=1811224 RepID=A0ABT2CZI9_9BURK|nr:glycosyltransferase [Massilia terrae]